MCVHVYVLFLARRPSQNLLKLYGYEPGIQKGETLVVVVFCFFFN